MKTRVVVFGTGSSALRVTRRLQSLEEIEITAYADNDQAKQGQMFEGRDVLPPGRIIALEYDYVVVASQYYKEIAEQLLRMGVPNGHLIACSLGDIQSELFDRIGRNGGTRNVVLASGEVLPPDQLPSILILTFETLNETHGTGVLLKRFFRGYPQSRLFSICHTATGEPWLPNSAVVDKGDSERLALLLRQVEFEPDLIYATAFNERDLDLLNLALAALPRTVPVIQHFMDYMPHDEADFKRRLDALLPSVAQLWGLTEGMCEMLEVKTGRPVERVSALYQRLPSQFKQVHDELGPDTRVAMIGNVWQPWVLPFLSKVWRVCQQRVSRLGPIEWYCHPLRVQSVIEAGYDLGPEIAWRGFVPNLQERLRTCDLAILPFNAEAEAPNLYTRLSLPSRIAEIASAGLPLFLLASPDTEPYRFVNQHEIGWTGSGPEIEEIAQRLVALLRDRSSRARLGGRARSLAEREFDLEQFRPQLLQRFVELARWHRRYVGNNGRASSQCASSRVSLTGYDRIHYACGRNLIPGWLNVDGFDKSYPEGEVESETAAQILPVNLTLRHPFPDQSFRFAYSEDFLEHLSQAEAIIFLSECYRTLKPGGVFRVSCPGLPGVLKRHLRGSDFESALVCKEEAYTRWWHLHFFCFESLEIVAKHIGFSKVEKCRYGESVYPELRQETRPDQKDLNLVAELTR